MDNSKNPYEKNSYLKSDEEVLKEALFFKKFGLEKKDDESDLDESEDLKEK